MLTELYDDIFITAVNNNYKCNIMSIGKAKRKSIDQEKLMLPGVGAYNVLHSQFNNKRGRSFTRAVRSITQNAQLRNSSQKLQSSLLKPGPGSYSVDLRRNQKIITFTHSKRFYNSKEKVPGPGAYKSEQCSKQKIKAGIICRSARITVKIKENIPGPGDYTTPNIIVYKKKEPITMFSRAKRNLGEQIQKEFNRTNHSKESLKRANTQNYHQPKGSRAGLTFQRAWHGRKLQKQAKLAQKDQAVSNLE